MQESYSLRAAVSAHVTAALGQEAVNIQAGCKHHATLIRSAAATLTFTADPLRPLVGKSVCSVVTLVARPLKAPTPAAPPMLQAQRSMIKFTLTHDDDDPAACNEQVCLMCWQRM